MAITDTIVLVNGDNPVLSTEIWKEIQELPYEISNKGNVRRNKNAAYKHTAVDCIRPYVNNKGYLCVNLYKNSKVHKFLLHRLIATYFISNPKEYSVVNHKDGDTLNNTIDNLEWCTQSYNMKHGWDNNPNRNRRANASVKRRNSTSTYKGVSWASTRNKWAVYITVDKKRIGIGRFDCEIEAAKAYDAYVLTNNLLEKGYSTNFS